MEPAKGLLIGLLVGSVAMVWATSIRDDPPAQVMTGTSRSASDEPPPPAGPGPVVVERVPRSRIVPVRVALDLVRAAALDGTASDTPLGANRTAALAGQLVGAEGEPIVGEVRCVAGPNEGRAVRTDAYGRFAAVDLHPGLSLIEVRAHDRCLARREVRLPAGIESRFHLALAQPARVAGRVVDTEGAALAGALVRIDGQSLFTDAAGAFDTPAVPAGGVLVEVTAEGYAATRRRLSVAPGKAIDSLRIAMRRESRVQITLAGHDRRLARVWLLPATTGSGDDTPWDRFSDLALGSEPLEVTGLPSGPARLFVHRAGAVLVGGTRRVELVSDQRIAVSVELAPTTVIVGRALCDGQPIAGARVELCAPDPLVWSAAAMQLPPTSFAECVLPLLPPARERATSDRDGAFHLTGGDTGSRWRELRVAAPGGRSAVRALWQGETRTEVELSHEREAVGRLVLEFAQQGAELAIDVSVQGESSGTRRLSPHGPLVIDDLPRGVWRVQVSTGVVDLLPRTALHLGAEQRYRVAFPPGVLSRFP